MMMRASSSAIRQSFAALRQAGSTRNRDIAARIGVSEGELIAAHAGQAGDGENRLSLHATRLRPEWPQIVQAFESLGEIMALTRNAACVHETTGCFRSLPPDGFGGMIFAPGIEARFFYQSWKHGFAVAEETNGGLRHSLLFFDAAGAALHKVFLRPGSNLAAYASLRDGFADGRPEQEADPFETPSPSAPVQSTTIPDQARPAKAGIYRTLLHAAAADAIPLAIRVGNKGACQTYFGPVEKIVVAGPWLNVLDPGFSLHLREDGIAGVRIADASSSGNPEEPEIEAFDAQGDCVVGIAKHRRSGAEATRRWNALIETIGKDCEP